MKLALGTVQFGVNYGVNNKIGIPSYLEISSILDYAYKNGINTLDSASAYGSAEIKIGKLTEHEFNIVSKFSNTNSIEDFDKQLFKTLKSINKESIYGYLAHNSDILFSNPDLWNHLKFQKSKGVIKKIGYSLYTTEQLEKLFELNMLPDLVQIPYNLLDRKFEKYFIQLKKIGVEIHTRSTFLQGLFFLNLDNLPPRFELLRNELTELKKICHTSQITMAELALNFVNCNPNIDKILIGVDSLVQLKDNINYLNVSNFQKNTEIQIKSINVKFHNMLNPVNWLK